MTTNNIAVNRGSEWRKWDLHVHTPLSIEQEYGGNTPENWERFISDLEKLPSEIKVIGINDYIFIDGYKKVLDEKQKGRLSNIELILPVIELRIDKFANVSENEPFKRVNFHIIFSNELTPEIIQEQFLNSLSCEYLLNSDLHDQSIWNGTITIKSITDLGRKIIDSSNGKTNGSPLKIGFNSLNIPYNKLLEKLENSYLKNKFLTAVGKTEWDTMRWDGSAADKKNVINRANFVFSASPTVELAIKARESLKSQSVNHKLLHCSDAHTFINNLQNTKEKELGHCFTWIKADPTFEGLKQIIYEYEERVKIQENNPIFDFEKSPFTEIQIDEDVQIFENEEDGVVLAKTILPINSGLVSIIGGRGTGKSILVDYISSGLGKKTEKNYTRNDKVSVKRKTSLKEEDTTFVLSNQPNIQFMYISQSEIKRIVEKPEEFTKNIRETIGVISEYNIPSEYQEKVDMYINELSNIIKVLEENNTNSNQKKEDIDKEIKRYSDFITNVTSQENKTKLEKYQKNLDLLANRKSFYESLQSEKTKIEQFQNQTNEYLQKVNDVLNEKFAINIPLINNTEVIDSISQMVLPKIQELIIQVEEEISNTKNTFANYNGDLTSLLNNVGQYQNKITDLQKQKQNIEDNEKRFISIKENKFKELGRDIENSINSYKQEIENKWENFKNGNDYTEEQRELISDILGGDNLNVSVEIDFDKEKLYQLLMRNLDGRSWNPDKLEKLLFIKDLQSYLSFVKQETEINVFSDTLISIRSYILDIFFRKFKEYISHNIIITSKNKNITKLSHGQRGTIYLQLKLAANIFSETIIYDQPEDDLDNEFIMSDLVSIFKKIKKYRQIIIVSHNANLVVNADSEQVIVAKNEDSTLSYIAGSLENPTINEQICKILEGGKEAFEKREMKYGFN